ncbi:hypothetical protein MN608_06205 [Microdochium nivale]|nr:hypothetical protein MN608_06205 [Microdochium nivale]
MSRLLRSSCTWSAATAAAATTRRISTSTAHRAATTFAITRRVPRRMYSSDQPKSKSPSSAFYKTFSRPIAKVFLLAIFTYQVAYYFWVRLEQDEMKRDMQATISELEARITELEVAGQKK